MSFKHTGNCQAPGESTTNLPSIRERLGTSPEDYGNRQIEIEGTEVWLYLSPVSCDSHACHLFVSVL